MTFRLFPELRGSTLFWRFHPVDEPAVALLTRLGFHPGDVEASGQAAIAAGKMLRACGAVLTDKAVPDELRISAAVQ